jgi:anti-sigma-K factor RskA
MKYDDDKDALAAEYVLGTLSSDERDQAEAMLAIDPGFEAAVRQWERRLGELNVMVEAVEPRPEVWDKIKVGLGHEGIRAEDAELTLPRIENVAPHVPDDSHEPESEHPEEAYAPEPAITVDTSDQPETEAETPETAEEAEGTLSGPSHLAALEASLFQNEGARGAEAAAAPSVRVEPRAMPRSADIIILAHRAAHWRRMTAIAAAIAALLAVYVAVSRIAPDLIPAPLRGTQVAAPAATPGRSQQDRLVAVLQQEPTAPAFLVTLDTRTRSLTVRRVAATPENGRSYQLWLIAKQFPNPQSLGVVGENEFTQRTLPTNYDLETLRSASYAVSLEPAGGSPNAGPTGPVLFTGRAVESLPSAPAAAPKT